MTESVTECRRLIKRIDELLHDGNSEEGHRELHELAHEFEKVATVPLHQRGQS